MDNNNNNPVGKIAKKTVQRSAFLLIRHSKYSAMLLKILSYTDCFFGDFAHWEYTHCPCKFRCNVNILTNNLLQLEKKVISQLLF